MTRKAMTSKTIRTAILALATAATLGTGLGAFEARAQYYGDDDRPHRFERRYDEDRYDRPRGYGRRGSVCVTARGNCMTRPAPFNAPCGCEVPGFGFKRGAIGG